MSFTRPTPIDAQAEPQPSHAQLAVSPNGFVIVTWERFDGDVARVHARVSRAGGTTFEPAVALSGGARSAGFPVVTVDGDSVLVAWAEENPAAIQQREAHHDAAVKEGKPVPLSTAHGARVLLRSARP